MSNNIYSTGAALICVGPRASSPGGITNANAVYLGTCEARPKLRIDRKFLSVFNDLGGPDLPLEYAYTGKEAMLSGIFNRFDMSILRWCMSVPQMATTVNETTNGPPAVGAAPGTTAQTDGSDDLLTMGTMVNQELAGFVLYLIFPKMFQLLTGPGGNSSQLSGGIAGYRFFVSTLFGPDDITPGVGDYKQAFVFKCQRQFQSSNTMLGAKLQLYDHNLNGLSTPLGGFS